MVQSEDVEVTCEMKRKCPSRARHSQSLPPEECTCNACRAQMGSPLVSPVQLTLSSEPHGMIVPLRRNPTKTAIQNTVSLSVHELLSCGLPMTLSNFARGLSPQRRWEHAPSLRELTLRYDQWTNIIKTRKHMAQCRHIDACRIRHETPSLVLSVRTLMSFPSQHNAHCVSLPKERKAVAEVPQRKHWRLPGTPRMLLFIEETGRRNRGCSDRGNRLRSSAGVRRRK